MNKKHKLLVKHISSAINEDATIRYLEFSKVIRVYADGCYFDLEPGQISKTVVITKYNAAKRLRKVLDEQ